MHLTDDEFGTRPDGPFSEYSLVLLTAQKAVTLERDCPDQCLILGTWETASNVQDWGAKLPIARPNFSTPPPAKRSIRKLISC